MSRRRDRADPLEPRRGRGGSRRSSGGGQRTSGKGIIDGLLPASAEPGQQVPRRLRIEGDLHHRLITALAQLRDPRLESVSVNRVKMTDDLQHATVYVRLGLGSDEGAERRKELLYGLGAATGRLRRDIAHHLNLRYAPELRFLYDEGPDAARRVDELLAEIHRDDESR